jgi:hypothetical protein
MILIANVGNRNLNYQGVPIPEYLKENNLNTTFRELTKSLYTGNQEAQVSIAILDVLLDAHKSSVEKLVLIATDQKKGDHRDQDTKYAAELIKRKIKLQDKWQELEVDVKHLPISIEKTADVMKWYKRFLIRTKEENPGKDFLICDAGGAPQMKTPLKIMAEFILPRENYRVEYVQHQQAKIIEVEQEEYRKVLASYQIESLLTGLHYGAAIKLWKDVSFLNPDKDNILLLLKFLNNRSSFLTDEANAAASKYINRSKSEESALHQFIHGQVPNETAQGIPERDIFRAKEYLELAAYYRDIANLNQAVMFARFFEEHILNVLLESYLDICLNSDYGGESKTTFTNYAKEHRLRLGEYPIKHPSIPAQIVVAKTIQSDIAKSFCSSFEQLEINREDKRYTLGALRNELAHKGRSVTKKRLQKYAPRLFPEIDRWKQILEVENENSYQRLNTLLSCELRNN